MSRSSDENQSTAAAAPVTVRPASLVRPVEGFAAGDPLRDEGLTEIAQRLLPTAGTTSPSTVLAGLTIVDLASNDSVIAFAVGPPGARVTIPFRGPTDCAGSNETLAGQRVCVIRLDDESALLRWGGREVWLGVFTEQRPDLARSVMTGLVAANLAAR